MENPPPAMLERPPEWVWVVGSAVFYVPTGIGTAWWMGPGWAAVLGTEPVRDTAVGLVAGLAVVAATHLGIRALPAMRSLTTALEEQLGPVSLPTVAALALLSGTVEELVFRGYAQAAWGVVPATVAFGLIHVPLDRRMWFWPLFALAFGVLAAALTVWTGAILAAVVAHVVTNAVNLGWVARRAADKPG